MKTVLITGASGGIGGATARLLAAEGYNVALNYNRNAEKAKALEAELNISGGSALAIKADVSDAREVACMFNTIQNNFGAVDVLVNNAGVALQKLFTDVTPEEERLIFGVNLFGTLNCCRAALPDMLRRHSGKIINVSSVWGLRGASCEVDYSASKAAVIGLTKALAKEVGLSGICVNCVAPGVINTPMNAALDSEAIKILAYMTPLGRTGTPEEIAELIVFLASDKSGFLTGQVIGADGGFAV